jgi:hypothetical protein
MKPPFRLGRKQKRAVLDAEGNEVVVFPKGREEFAELYVEFLNERYNKSMKATFKYEYQVDANDLDEEQRTFTVEGNTYIYNNGKWFDREGLEIKQDSLLATLNEDLALSLEDWLFDELEDLTFDDIIHNGDLTFE